MTKEIIVSQDDLEKVWHTLMAYLCPMHRTSARNGRPTDYMIDQHRADRYSAFTDPKYFRRLLQRLAEQYREIDVERGIIRLTEFGIDNCKKYDPTFQDDF